MLVIFGMWESGTAVHPEHKLSNTENMRSKLRLLNLSVSTKW